ncbi:dTMP kinase [Thorsellia kenyensis]|uniref:Thymidylate kinase n=1 Tax=Thorsellia kenyensis TaxID=1549888 RepID=A0ABV6CET2_9GAMM
MTTDGQFFVVEGLEGAGKTNAQEQIKHYLQNRGIKSNQILFTREPGGTPLAEKLRNIFKADLDGEVLTRKAELLVLYAARIQLVENIIKPALLRGDYVIGDRHDLSSQAYQGAGRGFDATFMLTLKTLVLDSFKPQLTLYLDVTPEIGLQRARVRGELDRIEKEDLAFFNRVREAYLDFAQKDPSIIIIDATQPIEKVNQEIKKALDVHFENHEKKFDYCR